MAIKEELVKKLAQQTKLDPRVVRLVADYPLKFVREHIPADEDWRPIRVRYFAVFTPKLAGDEYDKSDKVGQEYLEYNKSEVTSKSKFKKKTPCQHQDT